MPGQIIIYFLLRFMYPEHKEGLALLGNFYLFTINCTTHIVVNAGPRHYLLLTSFYVPKHEHKEG